MSAFSNLPFEERSAVFDKAMALRRTGLGYKRIMKRIFSESAIKIPQSTLAYWCKNKIALLSGENQFVQKATPELCYVLGTMFGDASISFGKAKSEYRLRLESIDEDFAEKFSKCISKLLNKPRDYAVCKTKRGMHSTQARSKQLYFFIKSIKEDFEKAKPFIEEYPAEFIQGLADSEGCPAISVRRKLSCGIGVAYSTNYALLEYSSKLLKLEFGIYCFLKLHKMKGAADSKINDRIIKRTKNIYVLGVRKRESVKKFYEKINFSIARKKIKLSDALSLLESYSAVEAARLWRKMYLKVRNRWIKEN